MAPAPRQRKHKEFTGIEKYVWEGLNRIGLPVSNIKSGNAGIYYDRSDKDHDEPIWHYKSDLDRFVADSLRLNIKDYDYESNGRKQNKLYNAVATEIRVLRKKGILIDLGKTGSREGGIGIWRLDKTRLVTHAREHAQLEMRESNYYSKEAWSTVIVRGRQSVFRETLLREYKRCVFCSFKFDEYMTGAHIVPYNVMRISEPQNAMNPRNGLLLCKMCDTAFERGSITVQDDFGIEVSDILREERAPVVKSWVDHINPEILIRNNARYPPDPRYLKWKRDLVS